MRETGCVVFGILGFFLFMIVFSVVWEWHEEQRTITVVSKERVVKRDSSYYLVFCEDEVYKVDDSMLYLTWDASDRYNKLTPGNTYNVRVSGWRWHFGSSYRNIIELTPTTVETEEVK